MSEIKQIRYKERFAILYEAKKRPFVHAVLSYNYNPGGQNKLKPHHHVLAVDFRGDVETGFVSYYRGTAQVWRRQVYIAFCQ